MSDAGIEEFSRQFTHGNGRCPGLIEPIENEQKADQTMALKG
jgi:hypothetical protein